MRPLASTALSTTWSPDERRLGDSLGAGKASSWKSDEGSSKDVSEGSDEKAEYAQGVLDAIADKDPKHWPKPRRFRLVLREEE